MTLVFFYPQFKKLTGAERLILKLADYVARALGDDGLVVLLTHRMAEECKPALGVGVRLVETGWELQFTGNHYLDAAIEYALGPALALRIPRAGIDGIVFFGPPSVPAMWLTRRVLLRAWEKRVPVLYFCFEPPRFIYRDTEDIVRRLGVFGVLLRPLFDLYRRLDRRMVRSAHRMLSNSPFGSRKLWDAYRRPATVIEHGVDFSRPSSVQVESLRARYGLNGKPVAITVNHLHPRKRIDLFLETVNSAARQVPQATAIVVGGGPEETDLRRLATEIGMREGHEVIFTGAVPEEDLPAHYSLGDVYVHTGREESFGLSVIEAMALGLPVVSVSEGGPCDTVQHGSTGYLVQADPGALAEATARLLGDPVTAQRMGKAGSQYVKAHFSWENGAATLLRTFDTVRLRIGSPVRKR